MNRRHFIQFSGGALLAATKMRSTYGSNNRNERLNHWHINDAINEASKYIGHEYDHDVVGFSIDDDGININYDLNLNRGQLIVIAGRPSMGKSILIQNIVQHIARIKNIAIGYFSEVRRPFLMRRMVAAQRIIGASGLSAAIEETSNLNIILDDTPQVTMDELLLSVNVMVRDNGIQLLAIDGFENIFVKGANTDEAVSKVFPYLKQLAQDLNIPIIITARLNHDLENREDNYPRLTDLYNYRIIERSADSIAYIYRDEVYEENSEYKGTAVVKIVSSGRSVYSSKIMRFDCSNFCFRCYHIP